jgi:transposase
MKKSNAGRKSKKTVAEVERLLDNLRQGMSQAAAISQSGIGKTTFYNWLKTDDQFKTDVESAEDFAEAVQIAQIKALGEAKMDWRAYAWLLERRFPDRWSAKRETEVTINQSNGHQEVLNMIRQAQGISDDEQSDEN